MNYLVVQGARLSTLSLGAGSPVVMLHGLISGNMASWYSSYATPLAQTRRVVLYDQRGHGDSSLSSEGFGLDRQVRDLDAVLAHHACDKNPVDVVGHSMGALIALHFALLHPDRVKRLVLVDVPMPARDFIAPSLVGVTSPEALATYVEGAPAGRRRERLHKRLCGLFFESTLIRDVLAMDEVAPAALARLECPVLLVHGRQSPCLAVGHQLHRSIPGSRLELLDCGHYVLEEAPTQLRALLDDFLDPGLPDKDCYGRADE